MIAFCEQCILRFLQPFCEFTGKGFNRQFSNIQRKSSFKSCGGIAEWGWGQLKCSFSPSSFWEKHRKELFDRSFSDRAGISQMLSKDNVHSLIKNKKSSSSRLTKRLLGIVYFWLIFCFIALLLVCLFQDWLRHLSLL